MAQIETLPTCARFQGRIAVVTGAARGIGRAIALELAAEAAAAVVILDRREAEGQETARLVEEAGQAAGTQGLFLKADVTQAEELQAAAEEVRARFGRCHALVNDAGISGRHVGDGPVHTCSLEAWERVLAVNLTGVFLASKSFIPLMLEQGGAVVNIASDDALLGSLPPTDTHAYSASKGGVIALTRAMAVSYAEAGIRVNAVAPGWVATPMTADIRSDPQMAARLAGASPLNRIASPQEIARAVAFLASDDASFVTGVTLPVEGGSTVW